jgi:hypothetical protein
MVIHERCVTQEQRESPDWQTLGHDRDRVHGGAVNLIRMP